METKGNVAGELRRPAEGRDPERVDGEKAAALDRLMLEPARARANRLTALGGLDLEALKSGMPPRPSPPGPTFELGPGEFWLGPPCDAVREGQTEGPFAAAQARADIGWIWLALTGEKGWKGPLLASAAVGITFEVTEAVAATVAPLVGYKLEWGMAAMGGFATCGAMIGFLVEDVESNSVLRPTREVEPVQAAVKEEEEAGDRPAEFTWEPPAVAFGAQPHRPYRAWVWAYLWGSQTGEREGPWKRDPTPMVVAGLGTTVEHFEVKLRDWRSLRDGRLP